MNAIMKLSITALLPVAALLQPQGLPTSPLGNNGSTPLPPRALTTPLERISAQFRVPVNVLEAISFAESSHNKLALAHNPAGDAKYGRTRSSAYGLMQVRGLWAGTEICPEAVAPTDLYEPITNVTCGTRLLRHELNRFGDDLKLALAAYNGGPKCVRNGSVICPEASRYAEKVLTLAKLRK